jgi:type I restriction enzyme S subunit
MTWRTAQLGDICSPKQHKTIPASNLLDDGFPVYGANGQIGFYSEYTHEDETVAITCRGATCGTINVAPAKSYITGNAMALDDLDKRRVDLRFLVYALRNRGLHDVISGSAQPQITRGPLLTVEIPLPPLEEQKRIAAILDQADELRRKRQRALDRLNQLGQAIFIKMFGDPKTNPKGLPWSRLGDVAAFYSGNSLPEGESFSGRDDGHLLLKVSDLNHPLNQYDIVCAASWSAAPGSRAGTCPQDALIFPKRGGAIGTNKKRWLRRSAILDPNLMGVHPDQSRLTMSFLLAWFETFNLSDIASGSSVPQLNKQDLAPLKLALPPLGEQIFFAERMDEITSMRVNLANAHSCDSRLFEVLQHHAFRGELTTSTLKEAAA